MVCADCELILHIVCIVNYSAFSLRWFAPGCRKMALVSECQISEVLQIILENQKLMGVKRSIALAYGQCHQAKKCLG